MAINWVDRVPAYPNRYKVTKSDGSYEYVTLTRADDPTVAGTPMNAANMNTLLSKDASKNVVTSTSSDTPKKWKELGTGIYWFSQLACLNKQPSQYGFVFNIVYGDDIRQMWLDQLNGNIYHRTGNASGWVFAWTLLFNSVDGGGNFTGKVTTTKHVEFKLDSTHYMLVGESNGDFAISANNNGTWVEIFRIGKTGNVKSSVFANKAGDTFTGNVKAYEAERTDRGLFNEEIRKGSSTGTLQKVKYFINQID